MLRLALAATMISCALGETYNGKMFTLYGVWEVDAAGSNGVCVTTGATSATGTAVADATLGPKFLAETDLEVSRAFPLEVCIDLTAANQLSMGLPFVAHTHIATHKILDDSGGDAVLSVKLTEATAGVNMLLFADAGCVTADTDDVFDAPVVAGYQCATNMGLTTGFATTDASGVSDNTNTLAGIFTSNYIKFTKDTTAGVTAGDDQTCSTADTTAGQSTTYLPVADTYVLAHPATLNTALLYQGANCLHDDLLDTESYQVACEKETGDIVYTEYGTGDCSGAADDTVRWTRNNTCVNKASNVNWQLATYTAAEWTGLCPNPGDIDLSAAVSFTAYLSSTANCAANDGATAANNLGTRPIILDVCYTMTADGEMGGFTGPFSDGTTTTEIVPDVGSMMWSAGTGDAVTLTSYGASTDCSGTALAVTTDDPAGGAAGWPCDSTSPATGVSHGGGSAGHATKDTGGNYFAARRHLDKTTGGFHNMGGQCHGTEATPQGQRVDYFKLGSSATDACYQNSTTTSYSWWCGSDYSINYEEYTDTACATPAAGTWLHFTQTDFDTCTGGATADTACGTGEFDTTTDVEASATAATLSCTGTCTDAWADADEWGGKCLQRGAAAAAGTGESWELLLSNSDWDAICGASTTTSTDSDDDSSAGKVAATVAAGAAAAAALLI